MTMRRGSKQLNEYALALDEGFYMAIPKAVLAAIAVSALTSGGDYIDQAQARVAKEWETLHNAGVVPQAVPAKYRVDSDDDLEDW